MMRPEHNLLSADANAEDPPSLLDDPFVSREILNENYLPLMSLDPLHRTLSPARADSPILRDHDLSLSQLVERLDRAVKELESLADDDASTSATTWTEFMNGL